MADKIGGYLYWKRGFRDCLIAERLPVDSPTPEPRDWLEKIRLSEPEMGLSLPILEKRYPFNGGSST